MQTVGEERAHSFNFRIESEDVLIEHALKAPILGWTGFGRNRVLNEEGKDISVTDGYWVIVLGIFGITGLMTFLCRLVSRANPLHLRFSSRRYGVYDVGAIVALSLFTIILSIDCLLNAFWTVVYPLCLGGLSTVYGTRDSKLIDWTEVAHEEDNQLGVRRRLWPAPVTTSVIETNSDARRIPATPDFDTIEDESTLNETR